MPDGLHDRALDNWRPLIAIADLAGGAWATGARAAAIALTGVDGDDDPIAEELLVDRRSVFEDSIGVSSGAATVSSRAGWSKRLVKAIPGSGTATARRRLGG